jgi:hypothetical protein
MSKVSDQPPWFARNKRERQQMIAFVNAKLDEIARQKVIAAGKAAAANLEQNRKAAAELLADRKWHLDIAIAAAERGDPEPLRRSLEREDPRLRQYTNLPKRKRGQRFKRLRVVKYNDREMRLKQAVRELPRIRAIWKEAYGKTKRSAGQMTAEEIVADRCNLTPDEVRKRRLSRP